MKVSSRRILGEVLFSLSWLNLALWRDWAIMLPKEATLDRAYLSSSWPVGLVGLWLGSLVLIALGVGLGLSRLDSPSQKLARVRILFVNLSLAPLVYFGSEVGMGSAWLGGLTWLILGAVFLVWKTEILGRLLYGLGLLASPFVLFTFGGLVLQVSSPSTALSSGGAELKRQLIVLVFDELDEGYVFQSDLIEVSLPRLKTLRREGFVAKRAYSPSGCTLYSIPALFSGHPVSGVRAISSSDLQLEFPGEATGRFSDANELLATFREVGTTLGLSGYYHPYCRLFGTQANDCQQYSAFQFDYGWQQGRFLWDQILSWSYGATDPAVWIQVQNFLSIQRHFRSLLGKTLSVRYAHFPIPRPPGILDPSGKTVIPVGGYSEWDYQRNLIKVDQVVGETLDWARGQKHEVLVLVTSDHGYRDFMEATELTSFGVPKGYHVPWVLWSSQGRFRGTTGHVFNTVHTARVIRGLLRDPFAESTALSHLMGSFRGPDPTAGKPHPYCKVAKTH